MAADVSVSVSDGAPIKAMATIGYDNTAVAASGDVSRRAETQNVVATHGAAIATLLSTVRCGCRRMRAEFMPTRQAREKRSSAAVPGSVVGSTSSCRPSSSAVVWMAVWILA